MKRKIFSKLLMVAMLVASVSSFVSCKDYDDDINNLQDQINKAALASNLEALKQTVDANATAAKAAADAAEASAKKYAEQLAAANAADIAELEALIAQVKGIAEGAATKDELAEVKAIADAAATQAALTEAVAELNGAIAKVKEIADAAATKDELADAVAELNKAIAKVEDAAKKAQETADKAVEDAKKAQDTADKANTDLAKEVERAKKAEEDLSKAVEKALADAKKYADDAAAGALADAKKYTDTEVAKAAAKAADDLAKAIAKIYTKTEVDKLISDAKDAAAADAAKKLSDALGDLGKATVKEYVNDQIGDAVEDLKDELADTYLTKADFEKIAGEEGSLTAAVNALYSAVTGVELFGSYTGSTRYAYDNSNFDNAFRLNIWGDSIDTDGDTQYDDFEIWYNRAPLTLPLIHGFVGDDSVFGDETDCGTVKNPFTYVKDADIKFDEGLVVRVNPVNADLSDAKIILINSRGEGLDDYVVAGTPVRYNGLITRGTTINTGLWIVPFTVKDGIDEDALLAKTRVIGRDGKPTREVILHAVAVKNTDGEDFDDDDDARYVTSTFDVDPNYDAYAPADNFFFTVDDEMVVDIRNRWDYGQTRIQAEQTYRNVDPAKYIYPELKWDYYWNGYAWAGGPKPSFNGYETDNNGAFVDKHIALDDNDSRVWNSLHNVKVDVPFTIANVFQLQYNPATWSYTTAGISYYNKIQYYYVTLDCHNAIESSPSEINAWESYKYDGLYTLVSADEPLEITIHDGAKSTATGDIIGFRVYAVNWDGTLADPDGKAFYVYVGEDATSGDLGVKEIVAKDTLSLSAGIDIKDVIKSEEYEIPAGTFVQDRVYVFGMGANSAKYINSLSGRDAQLSDFMILFYDNKDKLLNVVAGRNDADDATSTVNRIIALEGNKLLDAVKMKILVNFNKDENVGNLLDEGIYNFTITGKDFLDPTAVDDVANNNPGRIYNDNELITKQNIKFALKKVLPTTVDLPAFRPKQETADGSKKFVAYMVPDSIGTQTAANYPFSYEVADNYPFATTFGFTQGWGNDAEKKYFGTYTAKGLAGNLDGRFYGFKNLNDVFYNLNENKDSLYKFTFNTSFTDSVRYGFAGTDIKDNLPLVSRWKGYNMGTVADPALGSDYGHAYGIQWLNPYVATGDSTSYMLAVQKRYIDGETWHNIDVNRVYPGVSAKPIPYTSNYVYQQDAEATSPNAFQVQYSTWIKASKFTNNGIDVIGGKTGLQWVAANAPIDTLDLSKIKATNSYNEDLFGKTVADLYNKRFIYPASVADRVVFSTDSLPTTTSQINPYFKAVDATAEAGIEIIGGPFIKVAADKAGSSYKGAVCVLVTQKTVQVDAAPVADHYEWLVLKINDAYGFTENVSAKVKILKPATTPARKR